MVHDKGANDCRRRMTGPSEHRRADREVPHFVAVVSIVLVATAVGAVANGGHHRHPSARPAIVRSGAPVAVTPSTAPSSDFDVNAFVDVLGRVDPGVANQLIRSLSPADRAALGTELETSVGLRAG